MKISKNMKKLMSSIMMMALVFSSLVVTQKPAKAAEEAPTPTVKLMGATFRKEGTQALRFAIQIENADKANDCGITIRANGKEKTISVQNHHTKIYKKEGNTITYTAAVTGIPVGQENTNFEFSGFVTPIGGAEIPTGTNTRNLTEVATAAGYKIDTSTGEIVATPEGGDLLQKGNGNEGQISLGNNLGDQKVKISFEMRVQGATTDGVIMDFKTNYGGDNADNPSTPGNTIYNNWTQFSFQWNMPKCNHGQPVLYLTESNDSGYDAKTMDFYVRNFTVSPVYENVENAVEGTAVGVFSNRDGATEEFTKFEDLSLYNKTVAQLRSGSSHESPGIIVKFELPEGKTLANYKKLSVTMNADQRGYKDMGIDWRDSENNKASFNKNDKNAYRISATEQRYKSDQGKEWKTETFTLDYSASGKDVTKKQDGQIVYLGILYPADPNTTVKFTDIILLES